MSNITIIAEIGINHDGSSNKARQLILESANAGVHAVKFQYRNLENAYSDTDREIGDEIILSEINKNYLEPKILLELAEYAKKLGMQAGISFFDAIDMDDFGGQINSFDFFKLPSAELTNAALIDAMLETGLHVYLSTGCHSEFELENAFGRLPSEGWTPLHCISNYPVALQNARLGYLKHLQTRWNREVGYSSHDDNWEVCLLAMQLGAIVIERHITLDREAEGLDHSSSSTPNEFAKMCLFAKNMDTLLSGEDVRIPNQGELLNRQNLGRSFFVNRDLKAGDILSLDSLVYRSPNTGIDRAHIDEYLGKPVVMDLKQGAPITRSNFKLYKPLSDGVLESARKHKLALPVRLHDLSQIEKQFPIGAFEFHLSYEEIRSQIDMNSLSSTNRYSVHLPDYINSTQLMDPFSKDDAQKESSLDILERTVIFAEKLQELTGQKVPVVGSFSVMHSDIDSFFMEHASLLKSFNKRGVTVMPQWLPPIAWYFGGSIPLHAMNQLRDVQLLKQHELPVCMDVCHLFMGKNYFGFSADEVMKELDFNIEHIHIADASGLDGEGIAIGEGDPENLSIISKSLEYDCLKVIEVWQGHLDNGAGFHKALMTLANLSDE